MNLEEIKRQFKADPKNPRLAQRYLSAISRVVGYGLTDYDKALCIGANITLNKISAKNVKSCASLRDPVCKMLFPNEPDLALCDILHNFDKKFGIEFAVWCAKKVIHIWEEFFPNENSPQLAIEAAEAWLKAPSEENTNAAIIAEQNVDVVSGNAYLWVTPNDKDQPFSIGEAFHGVSDSIFRNALDLALGVSEITSYVASSVKEVILEADFDHFDDDEFSLSTEDCVDNAAEETANVLKNTTKEKLLIEYLMRDVKLCILK
jgi:hypothetical protein